MIRKRKLTKVAVMGTAVASAVFVLAVGASSFATTSKATTTHVTKMVKVPGGTMTIAEAAAGGPNYIFPMMGGAYFSVSNFQLIYMMFRPLYWFGVGSTPDLNAGLSVASVPVYSNGNKTVTVKLKGYKWSNGETVSAQDVLFWMNMLKADATSWAGFAPGPGQFPGDITNVTTNNAADTVTFSVDADLQLLLVHLQRAEPGHAFADRVGHHLRRCKAGFGRLLERLLQVGDNHDRGKGTG